MLQGSVCKAAGCCANAIDGIIMQAVSRSRKRASRFGGDATE
jgi:hypothetical protein